MRADRLLSILMLLQTRGRLTAQYLAQELEVNERTIYRDITALSVAGVPVYTERGPGGGISLVEDYRTNLTGLNSDEVRALFMLNIPAPLDQLGVGAELRTALLKLSAALPNSRRADETSARQRIHLDSTGWFQSDEQTPHLSTVQSALWQNHPLEITYHAEFGTDVKLHIAPYGLVAKSSIWYLVGMRNEKIYAWRISHIKSVLIHPETFQRPTDFDLPAFWKAWCDEFESSRPEYIIKARVSSVLARILAENQPETLHTTPLQSRDGWQEITLKFESLEAARMHILGYGGAIEVLEPLALRCSLIDFANQIRALYTSKE